MSESDTVRTWESYRIKSAILYKNIKLNFSWFPLDNHTIDFGVNGVLYTIKPGDQEPLGIESDIQSLAMPHEKAGEYAFYITDNFKLSPRLAMDARFKIFAVSLMGPSKVYSFSGDRPRKPASQ